MRYLHIIVFLCLLISINGVVISQPAYDFTKLKREKLDRGFVALRENNNTVNLSWRYHSSDPIDISFDLFRNGKKINEQPIKDATFFKDTDVSTQELVYELRVASNTPADFKDTPSQFLLSKDSPHGYINIPLNIPAGGVTPSGQEYSYHANDASVGDVDGDG